MDVIEKMPRFMSLLASNAIKWLLWSVKLSFLSLVLKYEKWEVYWIKNNENWAIQVQVIPSLTLMCLFRPLTSLYNFKVYLISISSQPNGFIDFLNQGMLQ